MVETGARVFEGCRPCAVLVVNWGGAILLEELDPQDADLEVASSPLDSKVSSGWTAMGQPQRVADTSVAVPSASDERSPL